MAPSVYIETSIVSYLAARPSRDVVVLGHQAITVEWWQTCLSRVRPFVSDFVLTEAAKGDAEAARRRVEALKGIPLLSTSQQVELLARTYIREKLVPESEPVDALHLALASANDIDYLLTWNCRHIAAATVRRRIAAINVREGCSVPILCTPEELMDV